MTLYGHVRDKDHLLTLLCSRICADVDIDRTTGLGWESVLRRLSIALRGKMLEVPALAQPAEPRQPDRQDTRVCQANLTDPAARPRACSPSSDRAPVMALLAACVP
jgi:hypothetical protein